MAIVPPTFVQEAETSWTTNNPKSQEKTFEVQAGDQIVVYLFDEASGGTLSFAISGGGLTWKQQAISSPSNDCYAEAWTATATATGSITVKVTASGVHQYGSIGRWGFNALTFRDSEGIGAVKLLTGEGAPKLGITTERDNSALVVANGDWAAVSGSSRTWRTAVGAFTEKTYAFSSGNYTVYGGYHEDAGATGEKEVGLSKPTGQTYTTVVIEVFGTEEAEEAEPIEVSSVALTETDALQAPLVAKHGALTALSEASALQPTAVLTRASLAGLSESGVLVATSALRRAILSPLTEASALRSPVAAKLASLVPLEETDIATAGAAAKLAGLSGLLETETIAAATTAKLAQLAGLSETASLHPAAAVKQGTLIPLEEADALLAALIGSTVYHSLVPLAEADVLRAPVVGKRAQLVPLEESSELQPLAVSKLVEVLGLSESDVLAVASTAKAASLSPLLEGDVLLSPAIAKHLVLAPLTETDVLVALLFTGDGEELAAILLLTDRPATTIALADQPVTTLDLSDRPKTTLTLETR